MADEKWLADAIEDYKDGFEGVYFTKPNEEGFSIVLGWVDGYEKEENLIQLETESNIYTLCAKIAYNCDDLQCDYEWDWEMPHDTTFEYNVYDASIEVESPKDIHWLLNELEYVTEEFKKGNLEKFDNGSN